MKHLTDVIVTPCGRVERLSPNYHQNLKQGDIIQRIAWDDNIDNRQNLKQGDKHGVAEDDKD